MISAPSAFSLDDFVAECVKQARSIGAKIDALSLLLQLRVGPSRVSRRIVDVGGRMLKNPLIRLNLSFGRDQ